MPRHVVVARLETLQNNNLQLIRFQDANAESRVEDELIQLPFDSLEVQEVVCSRSCLLAVMLTPTPPAAAVGPDRPGRVPPLRHQQGV
jgi:hypothetical protein